MGNWILLFQPKLNDTVILPGRVAQSVTCLVTDAKLTADPGVASLIPARSHTFVEIDHEIISTVILLPSAESFTKGCCQLQAKVCARLLVNCLFKLAEEKSLVRWTDRPVMTIAVDLGRKATKQTNKQTNTVIIGNWWLGFTAVHILKQFCRLIQYLRLSFLTSTVIMKHRPTGGPDWQIYLRSDKNCLVTEPTVPREICTE